MAAAKKPPLPLSAMEPTEQEKALLIRVIEESTFAGKLSRIIADLLDKLHAVEPAE